MQINYYAGVDVEGAETSDLKKVISAINKRRETSAALCIGRRWCASRGITPCLCFQWAAAARRLTCCGPPASRLACWTSVSSRAAARTGLKRTARWQMMWPSPFSQASSPAYPRLRPSVSMETHHIYTRQRSKIA